MQGSWPVLGLLLAAATLSVARGTAADDCKYDTCSECIHAPQCHWCTSREVGNSKCVHINKTKNKDWCTPGTPVNITTTVTDTNEGTNVSQILPQTITVSLRVHEEFKYNVTYRKLDDYPVDLYYLMDLSESMTDDKENLSQLGNALVAAMKKVTSNFRLGFGTFVDKVATPFVQMKQLEIPHKNSVIPYSFKNHMPLTNSTDLFTKKVQESHMSFNEDDPEGGFDALMQAIVCQNEINWRPHARHLLVMATDASFHIAGDGKLAGVLKPNDEKCHMKNNSYTHGFLQDYPSISQLGRQARNNSITLIFAVTKEQEKLYKSLVEHLVTGHVSAHMGILSKDSKNVVQLVSDVYQKLVDSVKLNDDSAGKDVTVTYRTRCLGSGDLKVNNTCHKIHAKQNVTFEVSIKVSDCPADAGEIWNKSITITPTGIDEKTVFLLNIHCHCPCEYKGNKDYDKNSTHCTFNGDKKCGICECYDNYLGKNCECAKDKLTQKESACISNSATNEICNNRGSCKCNVCACTPRTNPDERVYGKVCECDNFSCVLNDGKLCSGNGRCDCGKCLCNPGWEMEDCSCRESLQTCKAPQDDRVCSGAGVCVCGNCKCNTNSSGVYCEECMTCPGGHCKILANCVEHLLFDTGKYDEDECKPNNITIIEKRKHVEGNKDEKFCKNTDDSGCTFVFLYKEVPGGYEIIAQEEKECPAAVNFLGIVFGVIGGTVLIGLVSLLIWKLLTSIQDQREFAKFENDRAQSKWQREENPLYIQATTTINNPTFTGN